MCVLSSHGATSTASRISTAQGPSPPLQTARRRIVSSPISGRRSHCFIIMGGDSHGSGGGKSGGIDSGGSSSGSGSTAKKRLSPRGAPLTQSTRTALRDRTSYVVPRSQKPEGINQEQALSRPMSQPMSSTAAGISWVLAGARPPSLSAWTPQFSPIDPSADRH